MGGARSSDPEDRITPSSIFEEPPSSSKKSNLPPPSRLPSDLRSILRDRRSKIEDRGGFFDLRGRRSKVKGRDFFDLRSGKIEYGGFFDLRLRRSKKWEFFENRSVIEEPLPSSKNSSFRRNPSYSSSTPKIEEPPIFDLRIRRLGRRSPSAPQ